MAPASAAQDAPAEPAPIERWLGELGSSDAALAARAREGLGAWIEATGLELEPLIRPEPAQEGPIGTWLYVVREYSGALDLEGRIELLERARRIADRVSDPENPAGVYARLAAAQLEAGAFERADEVIATGLGRFSGARIFRPLIELLSIRLARLQGRWSSGLERAAGLLSSGRLLDEAIATMDAPAPGSLAVAELHRRLRGLALGERARIQLELGRLDKAANDAYAALDLAESSGDPQIELDARLVLASAAYLRDDAGETLRIADAIVAEGLAEPGDPQLAWLRGMSLGGIALQEAVTTDEAVSLLERALAQEGLDQLAALDAEWMLGELALAADDLERGARWLALARARFDSWGQIEGRAGTRELRLLANEAQLACRRGDDRTRLTELGAELDRGFEGLLTSWGDVDVDSGGVGFLETEERRGLLGALVRLRARLDGEVGLASSFDDLLRAQGMGSVARRESIASGDLVRVRERLLDGGRGALIYVVTGPTTHLLAVDADGLRHFELPGQYALARRASAFGAALLERLPPDASDAARAERVAQLGDQGSVLGAALLPPEAHALAAGWTEVGVVGLEALRGFPVEALGSPDGRLLGEALPVTVWPSIPLALADAERRAAEPEEGPDELDAAVVAFLEPAPSVALRFPGLARVAPEALELRALMSPYDEARSAILADPPPTLETLVDALDRAAVVQVLAHGVFDPFRERGAGLVLAGPGEQGLIWPEDLERLPRRSRGLVLLTSCGTSVGPRRVGDDEPTDLAGALLDRGASGVLTTRAKLELALAQDLGRALHRELARGRSPAEALRRAKAALGADDRVRAYELAQVRLLGAPRNPLPLRGDGRPWLGPALLGVLLVGAGTAIVGMTRRGRVA